MKPLARATPLVVICTRDREAATSFYRDSLGLTLLSEDAFAAVFALNGATLRVSTVADWIAHEHTIFGFGVDDVAALVTELAARGVAFIRFPGFNHDASGVWTTPDQSVRVAWFKDPDGNLLSLTEFSK
jgi:catechol 2,3-dioxygenase-like lactoylglutathione lyase family enzyme